MKPMTVPGIAQQQRDIPIFPCKQDIDWPSLLYYQRIIVLIDQALAHKMIVPNTLKYAKYIFIESSEHTKTKSFLNMIIKKHQTDFKEMDALIVLGGGSIINLGTAVAAEICKQTLGKLPNKQDTFRPPFHFIIIPSNVLSMADVAYGSLGLLNDNGVKNSFRIMYDPDMIILDIRYLQSLPALIIKQGIAECLKHAFLQDCPQNPNSPHISDCLNLLTSSQPNIDLVFECVQQTIRAKADVIYAVNAGNESAAHLLSYGHVDAEPREEASQFHLSHGDAVLLGLAIELALAGPAPIYQALRAALTFTDLAKKAAHLNYDKETMRMAYRNSSKPRFRARKDQYYVIPLPAAGHYNCIKTKEMKIEMQTYSFDMLYDEGTRILNELKQLAAMEVNSSNLFSTNQVHQAIPTQKSHKTLRSKL
jgi:3-dehydroquinate synthetase